jgi:hypothetical protein
VVFDQGHAEDNAEVKIYESFVYEKNSILNNVYDLVVFAAKSKGIPLEKLFESDSQKKRQFELVSKINDV